MNMFLSFTWSWCLCIWRNATTIYILLRSRIIVPQKASGIAAQHLQCLETNFYLPDREFEWQLIPDLPSTHQYHIRLNHVWFFIWNISFACDHVSLCKKVWRHLPQQSHLQTRHRFQSCKLLRDACWVMLSWTEWEYILCWPHCWCSYSLAHRLAYMLLPLEPKLSSSSRSHLCYNMTVRVACFENMHYIS